MTWDELRDSMRRAAASAADYLSQSADIAGMQLRLSKAEKHLEETYNLFGKIAYRYFTEDDGKTESVAAAVAEVERAKHDVALAREMLAAAKRDAAERAERAKAERSAMAERAAAERVPMTAGTAKQGTQPAAPVQPVQQPAPTAPVQPAPAEAPISQVPADGTKVRLRVKKTNGN